MDTEDAVTQSQKSPAEQKVHAKIDSEPVVIASENSPTKQMMANTMSVLF